MILVITGSLVFLSSFNFRIAKEILKGDSRQGLSRCKKYHGTPLHWAKTPEIMQMLFDYDYELNLRSKTGDTPLHVMAKRQRFNCVITLLFRGAEANIPDLELNTPLHTACKVNIYSVHLLEKDSL